MPGGGSGSGGLWMRGHDTGTLYGWMVWEGVGYLGRAAIWTPGPLGEHLEQLFG